MSRILVIKLGALGDFVQATGPFAAIRDHHQGDHVVLLTTGAFLSLARACPWFDEVWEDERPAGRQFAAWLRLSRQLRRGRFDRVYDLQTSDRSAIYHRLMTFGHPGRPEWSGVAFGCSHPHTDPARDAMHTLDRQAGQLKAAGIESVPLPNLEWLTAETEELRPHEPYVLLVAGGAAHRPGKRWPAEDYAQLAGRICARGVTPVLIGTAADAEANDVVAEACGPVRDLTGRTSLAQIAALARSAAGAVGNDTGPMHVISAAGTPSVVLFSDASDPALCAPRGPHVQTLHRPDLADMPVAEVEAHLRLR